MPGSPRRSFDDGAVGLGIVAAMRLEPRSDPIPIVSACGFRRSARGVEAEGRPGRKRAYLRATAAGGGGGGGVVFFQSPERAEEEPPPAGDFLSRCCLCRKSLHGIDIFMYRGERAFCSVECRFHQMRSDEHREKCSNEILKSYEYSVSPHSAPMSLCY